MLNTWQLFKPITHLTIFICFSTNPYSKKYLATLPVYIKIYYKKHVKINSNQIYDHKAIGDARKSIQS